MNFPFFRQLFLILIMFGCKQCKFQTGNLRAYVKHYLTHSNVPNMQFPCCKDDCSRQFKTYSAFRAHVLRDHQTSNLGRGSVAHQVKPSMHVLLICRNDNCDSKFSSIDQLLSHLRRHILRRNQVNCPFKQCRAQFSNLKSFSSHLSRRHKHVRFDLVSADYLYENPVSHEIPSTSADVDRSSSNRGGDSRTDISANDNPGEVDVDESDLFNVSTEAEFLRNIAQFYIKLESKYLLPVSIIQDIIAEFQCLHECSIQRIEKDVVDRLTLAGISKSLVQSIKNDFINSDTLSKCNKGPMRSSKSRSTFYTTNFPYVPPEQIVLKADDSLLHEKCSTFQYVSVLKTLECLYLYHKEHVNFEHSAGGEHSGNLTDVHHGSLFKNNTFFHDNKAFQIILYQDAFEVVNPLGSARKKHKLIGVYFTLGNYPIHKRSTIDQMQLVLLCKELDLKEFGQSKVFGPLIKDLKKLESEGINVGHDEIVKGSVVCILGDNLGSHTIGGYVESFSAEYFCRYCVGSRTEILEGFVTGPSRTKENYTESTTVANQGGHHKGVKSNSVFNDLLHFHVVDGLPPCIGHDLFEGIVPCDIMLMINYFVKVKQWFTFEQLNRRMSKFKFEGYDSLDKPSTVNEHSDKLTGHAIQNWVFLRLFPLFVGRYIVDTSDRVWCLFLIMKQMVQVICSQCFTPGKVAILKSFIEDFLFERRELFPCSKLKPKHHFIVHYPELILKFGPLIRLWTLRFESKHSYFKKYVQRLHNFKSLSKTLAKKHQLLQALYNSGSLFRNDMIADCLSPLNANLYSDAFKMAISVHGITDNNAHKAQKLTFKGIEYKVGNVMLLQERGPFKVVAGKIQCIIVKDGSVILLVSKIIFMYVPTMDLYAFEGDLNSTDLACHTLDDFIDYCPVPVYYESGSYYVSPKHSLCP